jgi:F0F1-type ATP synthase membrane subunit c/vacuolar-type H+-ATPase subunit K
LEKAALSGKRPRRDWATFDDDEIRHSLERNSYPPRATSWDCGNLHHLIVAGVMNLGLSLL